MVNDGFTHRTARGAFGHDISFKHDKVEWWIPWVVAGVAFIFGILVGGLVCQ